VELPELYYNAWFAYILGCFRFWARVCVCISQMPRCHVELIPLKPALTWFSIDSSFAVVRWVVGGVGWIRWVRTRCQQSTCSIEHILPAAGHCHTAILYQRNVITRRYFPHTSVQRRRQNSTNGRGLRSYWGT